MKGLLYAFLGGAVVGCAAAILFAPESGKDLRERIRRMLRNRGIDFTDDDIDALVAQISSEIKEWQYVRYN